MNEVYLVHSSNDHTTEEEKPKGLVGKQVELSTALVEVGREPVILPGLLHRGSLLRGRTTNK